MSGLALSSGWGLVYLTAVHTFAPLVSTKKLFQYALFACRVTLRRSPLAAW